MELDDLKDMTTAEIAEHFGMQGLAIRSTNSYIPNLIHFKGKRGDDRPLSKLLSEQAIGNTWLLMGYLEHSNPVEESEILAVVIDGKYVPPRGMEVDDLMEIFEPTASLVGNIQYIHYNTRSRVTL